MKAAKYEKELRKLQVRLCHLQRWVKEKGLRVVIVLEGRDAAGKGGTIRALTERVSPRVFRVVALPAPSDREKNQVYFQRYLQQFPSRGEIVIFDRSWYNRAGVEYVMGFCTEQERDRFLDLCPMIERFLVDGGTVLIKIWLEVSNEEQKRRFEARIDRPAAPVEAEPHGSAVAAALVRVLAGARPDAEEDRHADRAVAHRPLRRQAPGAPQHDRARALAAAVQEAAGRRRSSFRRGRTRTAYDDDAAIARRRFVRERY